MKLNKTIQKAVNEGLKNALMSFDDDEWHSRNTRAQEDYICRRLVSYFDCDDYDYAREQYDAIVNGDDDALEDAIDYLIDHDDDGLFDGDIDILKHDVKRFVTSAFAEYRHRCR